MFSLSGIYFSPHPYIFFNSDRETFTFLGFYVHRTHGHIIDPTTGDVLQENAMPVALLNELRENGAPLSEEFDSKLTRLVERQSDYNQEPEWCN